MNFSQATESPIIETVRGTDISFPTLSIEDYIPWTAELHRNRKAASKKLIPVSTDALERFRMERMAEFDEPSMDAIASLVWTPAGARRVLQLSLAKSVADEAERTAIINAILPRRVIVLAVEVSQLYEKQIPPKAKGKSDPNDVTAQKPSADNEETGS